MACRRPLLVLGTLVRMDLTDQCMPIHDRPYSLLGASYNTGLLDHCQVQEMRIPAGLALLRARLAEKAG